MDTSETTSRPLTARALRFVELYLQSLNATKAATDAGYSPKTARSQGERLLSDPRVAAAVKEAQAARLKRSRVEADRIVEELEDLALFDVGDVFDFSADGTIPTLKPLNTIPERARRAIVGVKVTPGKFGDSLEVRFADKGANLTTLMRHHGLLIDRLKVEDDVPLDELERRVIAIVQTAAARKRAGTKAVVGK